MMRESLPSRSALGHGPRDRDIARGSGAAQIGGGGCERRPIPARHDRRLLDAVGAMGAANLGKCSMAASVPETVMSGRSIRAISRIQRQTPGGRRGLCTVS